MIDFDDWAEELQNSKMDLIELLQTYIEMIEENDRKEKKFPLQTIQSMAERWRVSRQNVAAWAQRHNDFPKELDGIIEKTGKTPKVYALCDVLKYENVRGLLK